MDATKRISVDSSSLLELKAELHRKQQESRTRPIAGEKSEKPLKLSKKRKNRSGACTSSSGRKQRRKVDSDDDEEERSVRKSRAVLEAKSRLYDELQEGTERLQDDSVNSRFLVNFRRKALDAAAPSADPAGGGNEWVEYTDELGRSRVTMRKDLPDGAAASSEGDGARMMSEDMRREQQRLEWEQREADNLDKSDVHYQDVRFEEARTHGTGYFEFSRDADERQKQKEELKRMRDDTHARREKNEVDKTKRQQKLQERLRKVRERKRLKMGLPIKNPLDEDFTEELVEPVKAEEVADPDDVAAEKARKQEEEKAAEEERNKFVREWDVGKDGFLKRGSTDDVMTQEEWTDKQRLQRNQEFAPPSAYGHGRSIAPTGSGTSSLGRQRTQNVHENRGGFFGADHRQGFEPSPSSSHQSRGEPGLMQSSNFSQRGGSSAQMSSVPPSTSFVYAVVKISDGSQESTFSRPTSTSTCGSEVRERLPVPSVISHTDVTRPPPSLGRPLADLDGSGSSHTSSIARQPTAGAAASFRARRTLSDSPPEQVLPSRGAQVAPPATAEYFGGDRRGRRTVHARAPTGSAMQDAINAGLSSLRAQSEHKSDKTFDL